MTPTAISTIQKPRGPPPPATATAFFHRPSSFSAIRDATTTFQMRMSSKRQTIAYMTTIDNDNANENIQNGNWNNVKADDGEALQSLFLKHCDKDGLMTKDILQTEISAIRELLVRLFLLFVGSVSVYLSNGWRDGWMD
jgi:hypothetical protein